MKVDIDNFTVIPPVIISILRKYTLKYSGLKGHDLCKEHERVRRLYYTQSKSG